MLAGESLRPEMPTRMEDLEMGDGLMLKSVEQGASLRCDPQKLHGDAREDGLWLTSTSEQGAERFRIKAVSLGRFNDRVRELPDEGGIAIRGDTARFQRPGLAEEYSVSVDGIRQDFMVADRPPGDGGMRLTLGLSGVTAGSSSEGVILNLKGSGRRIAYHKLKVTDADGRELSADFEIAPEGNSITVIVDDTGARYPVTVDPTFSDADWMGFMGSSGPDDQVRAMVMDDAGNLYLAGNFVRFGGMEVNRIVKWDGNRWWPLGSGMNNFVRCLAVSGTDLYAGGDFTEAGGVPASHVAKWNGSGWQALGKGTDKSVFALAVMQGDLYAGGIFAKAGDAGSQRVAKWSSGTWSDIGGLRGGAFSVVYSMVASGDTLYVGGDFSNVGPYHTLAGAVAKYSQENWSALDYGMWMGEDSPAFSYAAVFSLTIHDGQLYAGGYFDGAGRQADGDACRQIARWDGTCWNPLGTGPVIGVESVCGYGGKIYAGGPGGMRCWNGVGWMDGPQGIGGEVLAMVASPQGLHVGGTFTKAAGNAVDRYGRWDGANFTVPGGGVSLNVHALATDGSAIYAAGSFTTAGGVEANHVAKWNGSGWSALGAGMNGQVHALAVWQGRLYAGGEFSTAGGAAAANLAQWDGNTWSPVGGGLNAEVRTLAVWNDQLYVGGLFTQGGGIDLHSVARWNGEIWSPLGSGMDGWVLALAPSNAGLYVGGTFGMAGEIPARMVALWNGSAWQTLGEGLAGVSWFQRVNALCVNSAGELYAGGLFGYAGGQSAANIARWNGGAWSGLGAGGPDAEVRALAFSGNHLYAGGGFSTIQGSPYSGLACWDGAGWSAVGSGAGGPVNSLVVASNRLYVGGAFTNAGRRNLSGLAAIAVPVPPDITSPLLATAQVGSPFRYQITASNSPSSFEARLSNLSPGPSIMLPAGIVMDPLTGVLSGIPVTSGIHRLLLSARNSAGVGTAILNLMVETGSPMQSWAEAAGLTGSATEPDATPFNDGVPNLLKFAFNMNPGGPDRSVLEEGGSSGLPRIEVDASGGIPVLRVQFLRRRNSGLIYVPERAATLDSFSPMGGNLTVTPMDDTWERVEVVEAVSTTTEKCGFARVRVSVP